MEKTTPKIYVLVGVPGSGKTTWLRQQAFDWTTTVHIGTDKLIEQHAASTGQKYRDVFKSYMPRAVTMMTNEVRRAFDADLDVVWDQTNVTVEARKRRLRMVPVHYTKIAVVFRTPPAGVHARWLDRPGKEIPAWFIDSMIAQFEKPELKEGFDEIVYIN